jgi:hypothetical protein
LEFRRRGLRKLRGACNILQKRTYTMALVGIKTASTTGYCDCIHGCYELASLRDEDTGKSYCPRCAKEHLEMNAGIGLPQPAPSKISANSGSPAVTPHIPPSADPPGRLR